MLDHPDLTMLREALKPFRPLYSLDLSGKIRYTLCFVVGNVIYERNVSEVLFPKC